MAANTIVTLVGLPTADRQRAAAIYYDAFEQKFRDVVGREKGIRVLAAGLDAGRVIVAAQDGVTVGLAGLNYDGRHFATWRRDAFIAAYGWLGGVIRWWLVNFAERKPQPGQLLMDGLAVAAAMRGQGVGTLLLDAVYAFAREHGFDSIRLDVVNTNPRARQLYERRGFMVTEEHKLPWFLGNSLSFTAYTTMVKPVNQL